MFNLNDGRWGRGDEPSSDDNRSGGERSNGNRPDNEPQREPDGNGNRPRGPAPNQGPPDLDELWRDFNRKLGGLFGGSGGGRGDGPRPGGGSGFKPPDMKNAGVGLAMVAGVAVLIWLGTGFFIVNEGQQAVITQFGRYKSTVGAGFNWRLPYPIQRHELVVTSQIRSADVGRDNIVRSTGLRESAMLTEDENIVEIKFAVQYRLSDARAWLFESKNPADTVIQVAETAVREVVGKMRMDAALAEERDQIAPRVRALMQSILDRYKVGVEVVNINLQQGGVRPPEQVQAAFDDVLKAGQERERAKNEAQAYANEVVPRAVGTASRLTQEAEAYKARVRRAGAGRCATLRPGADRIPEGAAGHARPHVHRRDAAGLQQHQQGAGRRQAGFQSAVPAARQADAAVGAGWIRRREHYIVRLRVDAHRRSTSIGAAGAAESRSRDGGRSRERDSR